MLPNINEQNRQSSYWKGTLLKLEDNFVSVLGKQGLLL